MRRAWAAVLCGVWGGCGEATATPDGDGASDSSAPDTADTLPDETSDDTSSPDDTSRDTDDTDDTADSTDTDDTADTTDTDDAPWVEAFARVIPGDRLVRLELDFAPGVWATLLADWQQRQEKNEYPAAMRHDDDTFAAVGVRLKGLNSLRIPSDGTPDPAGRYPLKIDFDSQGGERFHGVDELALNACTNDPSRLRGPLTAAMYNAMGVDAAHMGFAEVAIDGAEVGPYVLAQVIDKRFLKERFGEGDADDGNLYKCVYNDFGACSLQWLGDAKADYYRTAPDCQPGFDDCGLVLQTNEDDPTRNDYADLIHFLDVLHHAPPETFAADLAAIFDVEHFLRLSAVAYATSNFDSYFGKGHNYYLYHRPADGRFQMIPWDFDLAYEQPVCEADIADPTCGQRASHPLVDKILAVPAWRARYLELLREVASTWLTRERHLGWITAAAAIVGPAVARDPNPPDVGTDATFATQTDPAGGGAGNLFDFVDAKRAWILERLDAP